MRLNFLGGILAVLGVAALMNVGDGEQRGRDCKAERFCDL
jgi:hypothetical protein